jgi:hypothetical protein
VTATLPTGGAGRGFQPPVELPELTIVNSYDAPPAEVIDDMRAAFACDGDTLLSWRMERADQTDTTGRHPARAWTFIGHRTAVEVDARTHLAMRASMLHPVTS